MNPRHLCQVRTRATPQKVLKEYEVEAPDWYYARHIAANKFRQDPEFAKILVENETTDANWWVDSVEL